MEDIDCWQSKFTICKYSERLLNTLTLLNNKAVYPVDINEVKKAIFYARKYHGSQMRQSGEPYYSHPLEVAYLVAERTHLRIPKYYRTDMIVTSLLHDTIEDTTLNYNMISNIFDRKIADQVESLTRIKKYGKISSQEILDLLVKQRKYDIAIIKICDRIHNLETLQDKPPEKAKKIAEESLLAFLSVATSIDGFEFEEQFATLCFRALNIPYIDHNKKLFSSDNYQLPSLI